MPEERVLNSGVVNSPLTFVSSEGHEEKNQTSFFNRPEAMKVIKLVRSLIKSGCKQEDIGVVISFIFLFLLTLFLDLYVH